MKQAIQTNHDELSNAIANDSRCTVEAKDSAWSLKIEATGAEIASGTIEEIRELISHHDLRLTF